jgi:glycosyltransferase involved in cell wall biosynthesis
MVKIASNPMGDKRITAVVITYNEAQNIERCLRSIVPVADEIIVLDSMSTDDTCAIASAVPNVKVHQHTWQGYSASKNFGNSLAQGTHILSVDADEALSPELQASILNWKKQPNAGDILEVNRLTNYCGQWIRHSGWYPEFKIRIFPKAGSEWQGSIHETLRLPAGKVGRAAGNLLHYSYPTVESHLLKIVKYADLAVEKDIAARKKYTLVNHGLVKPMFVFVRKYFFQAGFMDGFYGFVIALNSAYERFLRYTKFRKKRGDGSNTQD